MIGFAKLTDMDERAIKRLLLILVASIIVIVTAKVMLTKTFTHLNKAAAEKKQVATRQQTQTIATTLVETPVTSTAIDTGAAASSVESVAQ